jgi:CRP/FNR family transcriptional regulator
MPVQKNSARESLDVLFDDWFPQDDVALEQLRLQLQVVELPAGYEVFRRGDACRNYLVVIDGSVRVQALSPGGREVTLYRVAGGQSCVITTSCLISQEVYPAEGITELETTALVLPQGAFNEMLGKSEAFRRFVFANQGQRLSDLIHRIEDVAFGRVDARLARLLFDQGKQSAGRVSATHQKLASELGTAREVVSRQLKVFERRGWIRVGRGRVEVLDAESLASVWRAVD